MPASVLECVDYVHLVKFIRLIACINYAPSCPGYWFTSYYNAPFVGKFMSQLLFYGACDKVSLGIICTTIHKCVNELLLLG